VRVDFAQADARLRPGLTANAFVVVEQHTGALVVPNWAVRVNRTTGETRVAVRRGGALVEVPVTLGLRTDTVSEVLSGLDEGDEVVEPAATPTASANGG
jgi:hypothetical protein